MVEMGLLEADQAATRIRATVETLEALPKWRGNLYNWYDLNTLEVLDPPYVSSVDSGNYVAFLMAAAQLLRQHLSELDAADRELPARMDALAEAVDLAALYDAQAQLFFVASIPARNNPKAATMICWPAKPGYFLLLPFVPGRCAKTLQPVKPYPCGPGQGALADELERYAL